jgi:hypothetical protein
MASHLIAGQDLIAASVSDPDESPYPISAAWHNCKLASVVSGASFVIGNNRANGKPRTRTSAGEDTMRHRFHDIHRSRQMLPDAFFCQRGIAHQNGARDRTMLGE